MAKKAAQSLSDEKILKTFAAEVSKSEDRTYDFVISTDAVDREGDTIDVEGWDLKAYKRNPVVLWAHDYRMPPIARAIDIGPKDGVLSARIEFPRAGLYPFADTIEGLTEAGFVKGSSVGFLPKEAEANEENGGFDYAKQELLEFSLVPVPANPEALIAAKAAGVDVSLLAEWGAKALGSMGPAGELLSPEVLKTLESLREDKQFEVQTLIFPKEKWDSADACKQWARDHDFRADKVDETNESWRLRQREPDEFERLRTICINPSQSAPLDSCKVKAVGGPLKIVIEPVMKAGRTLSKRNEDRIRTAVSSLQAVLSEIEDQTEDEKQTNVIRLVKPKPPRLTREDVIAATKEAVAGTVRQAIRSASGRLD